MAQWPLCPAKKGRAPARAPEHGELHRELSKFRQPQEERGGPSEAQEGQEQGEAGSPGGG